MAASSFTDRCGLRLHPATPLRSLLLKALGVLRRTLGCGSRGVL